MKMGCTLWFMQEKPVKIPTDYRRHLLSLAKEAMLRQNIDAGMMEEYFGDRKANKRKNYSLSLHIPHDEVQDNYMLVKGNALKLFMTTNDYSFLSCFYTGLKNINRINRQIGREKDSTLIEEFAEEDEDLLDRFAVNNDDIQQELPAFSPFPPYRVIFKNFHMLNLPKTFSNEMLYKTLSPIVVRKFDERECVGYLSHKDSDFVPNLKRSLISQAKHYLGKSYGSIIDVELIKGKTDVIPLYCNMPAFSGFLKITAPPNVHEMICHSSIGAHRSTCGMLEVLG